MTNSKATARYGGRVAAFSLQEYSKAQLKFLGQKASYECIRMHPDNGKLFNRLVREHGTEQTWIMVK